MSKDRNKKRDSEKVNTGDIDLWLAENKSTVPVFIIDALVSYLTLKKALSEPKAKLRKYLTQLRRALGITASSEKTKSSSRVGARAVPSLDSLLNSANNHGRLKDWHKKQASKHGKKEKDVRLKMAKLEDIKNTLEEDAEASENTAAYMERLQSGGERDPALETAIERLNEGVSPDIEVVEVDVAVGKEVINDRKILDKTIETRVRHDFEIQVTQIDLKVEKLSLKDSSGEKVMVSASTKEFGPEGFNVTWNFLANLVIMMAQYAMPLNRIANMISSVEKKFSSSSLSKQVQFVASKLAPVYLELFNKLATSDVISGDDTTNRVLEVTRYFSKSDQTDPPPWEAYKDIATSIKTNADNASRSPLGVIVGKVLPFVSPLRDGTGGKKVSSPPSSLEDQILPIQHLALCFTGVISEVLAIWYQCFFEKGLQI
jgi:hypothetical protein